MPSWERVRISGAVSCSVFVSLDVEVAVDWWRKEHRSYFVWEFGKPPELVLEIVSNQEGGEDAEKKRKYAQIRISYHDTWFAGPMRTVPSFPAGRNVPSRLNSNSSRNGSALNTSPPCAARRVLTRTRGKAVMEEQVL